MDTLSALTIIIVGLVLHESSCQRDGEYYGFSGSLKLSSSAGVSRGGAPRIGLN